MPFRFAIEDGITFMTMAVQAIAQDEFTKCFEPKPAERSSKSLFMVKTIQAIFFVPIYCFLAFVRYFILFPFKLCIMMTSFVLFLVFVPLLTMLKMNAAKVFLCSTLPFRTGLTPLLE
jgi:hypothetical protein